MKIPEEIPNNHLAGENRRLSSGSLTTEPLPKIESQIRNYPTFDNFVQSGNIWAKATLAVSEENVQQLTTLSLSMRVDQGLKDSLIQYN